MKYFITILLVGTFFSCKSGRAREYYGLLDSTDQTVYRILVGDSMERNRLEALVAKKPDLALSIAKKQAYELGLIIKKIDVTEVSGIRDAYQLKKSTTCYYNEMLRLKQLDVLEAQLMAVTLHNDVEKAKKAGMDISNLIYSRLKLYKAISDSDQTRQNDKARFLQTNDIH